MNKLEIEKRLRRTELRGGGYWIAAGGAMVMRGIRQETRDIDLGCTAELADRLEACGYCTGRTPDGKRKIALCDGIDLFEDWLCDRVETVDGFPVVSVAGIIKMKEALGREKDLADRALIKEFLKNEGGE